MKTNWIALLLAVAAFAGVLVMYLQKPKIAFVRSHDLLENYKGTAEAYQKLEKFKEDATNSIDSLKNLLAVEIENYKEDSLKYTLSQKLSKREKIRGLQYALYQSKNKLEEEYGQKDNVLSAGVLNQVNDFVQKFAVEEGYDLVLGANEGGNILYGKEAIDVTDELLKRLNESYEGK